MMHTELAQGRWYTMSLAEQLGNVGSEYDRALKWRTQSDERFHNAFDRFLELLDMTIADQKHSFNCKRELLRLREYVCSEFTSPAKSTENLSSYFYQFGLLARRAS